MSCSKKEKYTGALIGAAIGDALGWPNEQNSKNIRKNRNSIRTYVEWNRRAGGKWCEKDLYHSGDQRSCAAGITGYTAKRRDTGSGRRAAVFYD